tara:strand:- start:279 stop:773 length:495 start_codon:yes stop_codon:yes gene_type:complete
MGYRVSYGGYLRREDEKNGNGKSNGSSNGNGNGGNGNGNGNGGSGGNGGGNGSGGGGVGENVEIKTANGDLYATIIDIISGEDMKPTLDSNGVWNGNKIVEKNDEDHEYEMIRSQMKTTKKSANRIHKKVKKGEGNIKAWVQSKITKATDYLDGVADYLDNKEE